jgi:hypothetical protein
MQVAGTGSTGLGGTVTLSANGGVGSLAWLSNPANAGLVEPGYHHTIAGVLIPNATLPTNFAPSPLPINVIYPPAVGGTNYNYAVFADGDYRLLGNLSLGSGQKMLIAARSRIHVLSNISVGSSGYILMTTNASVEFYCSGRVDIQGRASLTTDMRRTSPLSLLPPSP